MAIACRSCRTFVLKGSGKAVCRGCGRPVCGGCETYKAWNIYRSCGTSKKVVRHLAVQFVEQLSVEVVKVGHLSVELVRVGHLSVELVGVGHLFTEVVRHFIIKVVIPLSIGFMVAGNPFVRFEIASIEIIGKL